ncbi:MAG TPA: bacteriochlorophyll 4-vinyl reductase [Acidiphilium sp.]|nr:MAG: bacteriochlorophyll 4-vinyl reductase [Acidiphilium sp. 21-60-14]OYV90891.1 MAG: bacteriochlorophyll 4-vinyl reductase [Acidiphilium sp. 37-60-79]OZB39610.1 MAG: bacteriochlorophyll 4-vinyl reductase [Acidiphilium sp. 34-60-192]HQT88306.1 bacteriochlorophyll 4-vinyl reductase [Acidiphilium sp.]HQU23355.1 bacteriochlorophyll 4-vinyl reductase [Acidiphilium sp.]
MNAHAHGKAADRAGKIGPNAVIQLIEALRAAGLDAAMAPVFVAVGAHDWLLAPPAAMVDAMQVGRLHRAVRANLAPVQAAAVMADAGRRTADYLLASRIPPLVKWLLKRLPTRIAAMVLVAAIRAHAWTFAGSGRFGASPGSPTRLFLANNPLCAGECASMPVCAWHAAVFERLFQALVAPSAHAVETSCAACGDDCCSFVVAWRR